MNLNRAMIIGNLTRDPEVRTTTTGQNVASFGVATNHSWTDKSGQKQERAEFHNIVVWGKLAEICGQYLSKGRKVYIEGRLQTREWEGQDGAKRSRTEIIAENMIMLDRGTGAAIQHDHVLGDDFGPAALGAVLTLPLAGLKPAFDVDLTALREVLPADFSELAPDDDVVELRALLLLARLVGPRMIGRDSERGYVLPGRGRADLRVPREVADDHRAVEVHGRGRE